MTQRARVSLEPAWILHHYPYRDSSLLLVVFSHGYGRIGLIARGARSAKGRGELGTLTGVDSRGAMDVFAGRRVLCACYLNELLMRLLTRHDPHPELFGAYEDALLQLSGAEEPALRLFEKRLLQALGYGLLLDHEYDSGDAVEAGSLYEYRMEKGPVKCRLAADNGVFLQGASLLALHAEDLRDAQACREVKQLMRAALALYLGERPLRTREVLRQLSAFANAGKTTAINKIRTQNTG